jgi:hypothetical protein
MATKVYDSFRNFGARESLCLNKQQMNAGSKGIRGHKLTRRANAETRT